MSFILGALKIIIVLGTLVTIHELGHFLVAKACNVKVHKFSIGFGKKILCKQKGETEYTLRLFPFGGFVQLEGEDERSDDPRAFNNKPIWQRMLIIVAGATVNIVFALVLYYGICMVNNDYYVAQIDAISENSSLYSSELKAGDKILSINNKKTVSANDVEDVIEKSVLDNMTFLLERNSEKIEVEVNVPYTSIGLMGVTFDASGDGVISSVEENSPADNSGIKAGCKIIAINDLEMKSTSDIIAKIKSSPEETLKVTTVYEDITTTYYVVPKTKKIRISGLTYVELENLNFFQNTYYAINQTGYYFNANIKAFLNMFSGDMEDVQLIGPVGIAKQISATEAISQFLLLMVAISLSLGICNLLPVPALDGGKLLILFIELIRRKPMKENTEIAIQLVGLTLIMTLAIVVTIGDIVNLF